MKDQIQQIFDSGLVLSAVDGRLKVSGTSETIELFRPLLKQYRYEIIALLQPRGEVETCPAIVAPAMPETNAAQGAVALHCSDDDKALLAETVAMLTDEFIRVAPGNADQLIRAFNTVEAAERAGDQESFNFALNVLRSVVDDARQLAPGETCGGVAYG